MRHCPLRGVIGDFLIPYVVSVEAKGGHSTVQGLSAERERRHGHADLGLPFCRRTG
jgi:hypothetical protein